MADIVLTSEEDARFRAEALPLLDDLGRYARWLTKDEDEAADLVQETYLRAFRGWPGFRAESSCRPWLLAICRNTHLRVRSRGQRVVTVEEDELDALAGEASVMVGDLNGADPFGMPDLGDAVAVALDRLPAAFREAVILVDVKDVAYADAADILEIPIGTLRSRLFRGRRLLQEDLLAFATDAGLRSEDLTPPRQRGDNDGA